MIVVYEKGFFGSGEGTLTKFLFLKDGVTLRDVWNKAISACPKGFEINSMVIDHHERNSIQYHPEVEPTSAEGGN